MAEQHMPGHPPHNETSSFIKKSKYYTHKKRDLEMYLWSLRRTGMKPRKSKPRYLEKWNCDSRQDNGIDLIHLWKRLKRPRDKDFLFPEE